MPASIVESASPGLLDLAYDGDLSPSGVLDARMPPEIVRMILAVEPRVRASFVSSGQKTDCRYACGAWMRVLREQGVEAFEEGGVGVDEEQFANWQLVPAEARSGYREGDGRIHRHFWLRIGPDHLLFDPTAHQFDKKGGVSLDRYIIDGRRVNATPAQEGTPRLPVVDRLAAGIRRQFDVLRQMEERSGPTYELARERSVEMSAAYRDAGAPRRVSRVRTRDGWTFERHIREGLGQWRVEPTTEAEWREWTAWRSRRRRLRMLFREGGASRRASVSPTG